MRPEGCQETGPRLYSPQLTDFKHFLTSLLDALKRGTYTGRMTSATLVGALSWLAASPSRPALLRAQAMQRVDVRQRRSTRTARRCRTSAPPTSSSARTTSRAKSCASRRPPTRCRSPCSSTTARPREPYHPRLSRRRCRRSSTRSTADADAARSNEVAIITLGERPTILADYTTEPRAARQGRRAHLRDAAAAARTCSTAIIEISRRASRSARPPRPVIVAHRRPRARS